MTVGRGGRNPAAPRLDVNELRERKKRKKKVILIFGVHLSTAKLLSIARNTCKLRHIDPLTPKSD